jgi:hypothetical protein
MGPRNSPKNNSRRIAILGSTPILRHDAPAFDTNRGDAVMSIQNSGPAAWEVAPLVVKPKIAWRMLACSNTRGYALLNSGELESFLDGRSRKITVESIRQYIARRITPGITPSRGRRRRQDHDAREAIRHEP